jgi:hypothetical protein
VAAYDVFVWREQRRQAYRGVIIRFEFPSKARLALTVMTIFSISSGWFGCMARKGNQRDQATISGKYDLLSLFCVWQTTIACQDL